MPARCAGDDRAAGLTTDERLVTAPVCGGTSHGPQRPPRSGWLAPSARFWQATKPVHVHLKAGFEFPLQSHFSCVISIERLCRFDWQLISAPESAFAHAESLSGPNPLPRPISASAGVTTRWKETAITIAKVLILNIGLMRPLATVHSTVLNLAAALEDAPWNTALSVTHNPAIVYAAIGRAAIVEPALRRRQYFFVRGPLTLGTRLSRAERGAGILAGFGRECPHLQRDPQEQCCQKREERPCLV